MALDTRFEKSRRYLPGQNAPVSGLYRVHHGTGHREDHDVIILRGEEFAACRSCKSNAQFTIKKHANYITDDFDFAAPIELIASPDYFKSRVADAQDELSRAQFAYAQALQRQQRAHIRATREHQRVQTRRALKSA